MKEEDRIEKFVLDCSTAMSWCFPDENSPTSQKAQQLLFQHGAVTPAIWPLEILNTLLIGERRKRITSSEILHFLHILRSSPIVVDITPAFTYADIYSIGRQNNTTSYDASYLELALRLHLPLATLDDNLRKVAESLGITLL